MGMNHRFSKVFLIILIILALIGTDYTSSSSAVFMSLLSEPIPCSWMPPEKENSTNMSKLVPLGIKQIVTVVTLKLHIYLVPGIIDKPPSGKKMEETKNYPEPPELNLDLYTIPESCSEENTDRSDRIYFTSKPLHKNKLVSEHEAVNLDSDLCLEDIDEEITNINNVEKQTDLILKDLQKEQNQLTEIVNDIDKLFEKDESSTIEYNTNSDVHSSMIDKLKCGKQNKITNSLENQEINRNEILQQHDMEVSIYGDIVTILEELEKENTSNYLIFSPLKYTLCSL